MRQLAGWHLEVGPHGTVGHPVTFHATKNTATLMVNGDGPGLDAAWANDLSPYDQWLDLLRHLSP